MEMQIYVVPTPNPNALKFILSQIVKADGKATFKSGESCPGVPLVEKLLAISQISQIHLFDNTITVSKKEGDWEHLSPRVQAVIKDCIFSHDPEFEVKNCGQKRETQPYSIQRIENILDRTIRTALRSDGGDVEVVSYEGHELKLRMLGACGGCPATAGTFHMIEKALRQEFDPDLKVILV